MNLVALTATHGAPSRTDDVTGESCCEPHSTPGCGDKACEAHVCKQDPFCCESWWNPYCANEANGRGGFHSAYAENTTRRSNPDNSSRACAICRVPSVTPPLPRNLPPYSPPGPQPPPPPTNVIKGGTLCFGFSSVTDQQHAITHGYHFRGAVASVLGLWDGALTMPVAQDAGCECGRGCSYNGCFTAGYRSEADGTYTEMVSLQQ